MKHLIFLFTSAALLCGAGCALPRAVETAAAPAQMDMDSMMRARDRVFPALLYIRVVMRSLESGEKSAREGGGSGFLISGDGFFVTNWHVVDKSLELRCLLSDGRSFPADVIGTDKDTDLALGKLRMPEGETVPFAVFGSSASLAVCDPMLVMGAPWGMSRSISAGIISCVERYLAEASEYALWLQTDASISPGNSGGPMVNTEGEVIAVTARGAMYGGNLGFGVPADEAQIILGQIRGHGKVDWSWTGIRLQPLRDFEKNIAFPFTNGVMVAETEPGSPARLAGVLEHDRLLAVNGRPVTGSTIENLPEIRRVLGLLPKGEPAALTLARNGETLTIEVTPREKGRVEGDELDFPRWGFTAKAINQFDTPNLHFYKEKGVFVFGVKNPGNAQQAGFREQDILQRVGARDIETLDDLKEAYDEAVAGVAQQHRLLVHILRGGMPRQIVLDFARDYTRR